MLGRNILYKFHTWHKTVIKACCWAEKLVYMNFIYGKKSFDHANQVEEEDQGGYQCQAATSSGGQRQLHQTSMKLTATLIKIGTMSTWPGARGMQDRIIDPGIRSFSQDEKQISEETIFL